MIVEFNEETIDVRSRTKQIVEWMSAGTRFYGLQIDSILNPYSPILDRVWIV